MVASRCGRYNKTNIYGLFKEKKNIPEHTVCKTLLKV